jgi:NADH-quinone oxidoreductase subunit I
VTRAVSAEGKPLPRASRYIYRMETCMYCNLCVEACPFAALVMTEDYECASADRGALTLDLVAERYELRGKKLPWWLAKFKGGQA